jgi:hypothetical protein
MSESRVVISTLGLNMLESEQGGSEMVGKVSVEVSRFISSWRDAALRERAN